MDIQKELDALIKDKEIKLKILPSRLRKARQRKSWTLEDAAYELDVTAMAVCFWETGKKNPTTENVAKILDIYDLELDEIIDFETRVIFGELRRIGIDILEDDSIPTTEKLEALLALMKYLSPDADVELDDDDAGKSIGDIFKLRFGKGE